jgi:cytochrome c oxidase subunit 4
MNMAWLRRWWAELGIIGVALLVVIGLQKPKPRSPAETTPPSSARHTIHPDIAQPNWRQLIAGPVAVWLVLLVLLAASCGSAYLPLGPYNAALNLGIAAIMLLLLAAFLMNLREASTLLRLVAAAGLGWAIFLFALTFTDYLSRRPTGPRQTIHSAALATPDRFEAR